MRLCICPDQVQRFYYFFNSPWFSDRRILRQFRWLASVSSLSISATLSGMISTLPREILRMPLKVSLAFIGSIWLATKFWVTSEEVVSSLGWIFSTCWAGGGCCFVGLAHLAKRTSPPSGLLGVAEGVPVFQLMFLLQQLLPFTI